MSKRSLLNDSRGLAALEAAIILPVFIMLIVGSIELYQFFRAKSIVERASIEIAQSLSLQHRITMDANCSLSGSVCVYEKVAGAVMQPLDFSHSGRLEIAVYTAKQESDDEPIVWAMEPGWPVSFGSRTLDTVPTTIPMDPARPEETVVAVTMAYDLSGLRLTGRLRKALTGSPLLTSRAYVRIRNDALHALEPVEP
jgi:hypothetical protein